MKHLKILEQRLLELSIAAAVGTSFFITSVVLINIGDRVGAANLPSAMFVSCIER